LVPILRLRLRSWLTEGDRSMGINQHKKTAIEAANIFKKQYLPFLVCNQLTRCRLRRYLIEITLSLSHTTFSLRMILKISVARMKIIFNKKCGTDWSDSGRQKRISPGTKIPKETSWFLFSRNKPSLIYKRFLIIRMLY
jgi:hypothetical protein